MESQHNQTDRFEILYITSQENSFGTVQVQLSPDTQQNLAKGLRKFADQINKQEITPRNNLE